MDEKEGRKATLKKIRKFLGKNVSWCVLYHFVMFYEKHNYLQYHFGEALVGKTIFLIERSALFHWTVETLVMTRNL